MEKNKLEFISEIASTHNGNIDVVKKLTDKIMEVPPIASASDMADARHMKKGDITMFQGKNYILNGCCALLVARDYPLVIGVIGILKQIISKNISIKIMLEWIWFTS